MSTMPEKSGGTRNWVYVTLGIVAFTVFYLIKSIKVQDVLSGKAHLLA